MAWEREMQSGFGAEHADGSYEGDSDVDGYAYGS